MNSDRPLDKYNYERLWYVADDLDHLALSYLDYFEVERRPARRFTTHLYRTATEASAAKADAALLSRYGAYFSLHAPYSL